MRKAFLTIAGLVVSVASGQTRFADLTPAQQDSLRKVLTVLTERREGTLELENLIATPVAGSGMLAVYVNFAYPDGRSDLIVCSLAEDRVWGECVVREGVGLDDALQPPAEGAQ